MKLARLFLATLFLTSTAYAAITVDSAKKSSSFSTYGYSYATDEGGRRVPMLGVVLPDSNGHTSLNGSFFTAAQYSPVSGLEDLPIYTLASGFKVPLYSLVAINPTSRLPVPLSSVLAGSVTLAGDVTGAASSNTVALVGGSTASNVHSAELAANAATSANTVSTIVKRDSSGNFSAGVVSASPKVPVQAASSTPTCAGPNNGTLALTSLYVLCVCNSSSWVHTSDGSTACTF